MANKKTKSPSTAPTPIRRRPKKGTEDTTARVRRHSATLVRENRFVASIEDNASSEQRRRALAEKIHAIDPTVRLGSLVLEFLALDVSCAPQNQKLEIPAPAPEEDEPLPLSAAS